MKPHNDQAKAPASPYSSSSSDRPGNRLVESTEPHPESAHGRRSRVGLFTGAAVLVLVACGVSYFIISDNLAGQQTAEASIMSAQEQVSDAMIRLRLLPEGHPLRAYVPELEGWQAELNSYRGMKTQTEAMKSRADKYADEAISLSDKARTALAVINKNQSESLKPLGPNASQPAAEGIRKPAAVAR